ncbi:serine/threonine-protein kinase [Chondromyces crocatus]|uniref:Protein kinase n=1 Tax=Chondromyces crocatus TaxID=52 RepID=A0A0K1ESU1_CHOCO|nr:serine/threonine-protein kinase [Chondromyces crocatus]AKT43707.1 protein kinase [Chondromyces crocatus]
MLGRTLAGKYRIVRLLGRGGMGSVYEAVDGATGHRVALKLVTADVAQDAILAGRFAREGKAAMALETPHVARVLDAACDEQQMPFLVMEYLEGEDLRDVLRRTGALPPDVALRVVAQAAAGLVVAHGRRIVHRDIKPANLFVAAGPGDERTMKILDFGIAKLQPDPDGTASEISNLTRTGSMLGSPMYMSPEQARGHRDIDERADLWSLGVVLFQTLSGRTPHANDTPLGELIVAICTEAPPPLQSVAPWVSAEVAAIVHRALQLDPSARFQSAAEMQAALLHLLPGGAGLRADMLRSLSAAEQARVAPALNTPYPAPRMPHPSWPYPHASGVTPMPGHAGMGSYPGHAGWASQSSHPSWPMHAVHPPHGMPDQATSLAGLGTAATPANSSRRTAVLALGVVLAMGVGGGGAYLVGRGREPEPAAQASTPPASAGAETRTVRIQVLPRTAEVAIDDVPVEAVEGVVKVSGTLGSLHRVRVRANGAEVTREVVITEQGALPPAVELVPAVPGAPSVVGAGSAEVPAQASAPSAAPWGARPAGGNAPGSTTATTPAPRPSGTLWLQR